jgi:hypothetical protein
LAQEFLTALELGAPTYDVRPAHIGFLHAAIIGNISFNFCLTYYIQKGTWQYSQADTTRTRWMRLNSMELEKEGRVLGTIQVTPSAACRHLLPV